MKNLRRAILGTLLLCTTAAQAAPTFFWRAEGTTLDGTHDYSDGGTGDQTASIVSAAAINTDAVRIGTNGLDLPTSGDRAEFDVAAHDLISPAAGAIAFSFRITTWVNGFTLVNVSGTDGVDQITVGLVDDDDILFRIRNSGGTNVTIQTAGAGLTTGTWYAALPRWDQAANDRRIEIFNASGALISSAEDLSTAYDQPTDLTTVRWGDVSGSAGDVHMDNMFIADAYAEPLEDYLDITSYTEYGAGGSSVVPIIMQHQ